MLRVDLLLFMLFLLSSCGEMLPEKGHLGQPCTEGGVCVDGSECVDDECVASDGVDGDQDQDMELDDDDGNNAILIQFNISGRSDALLDQNVDSGND